MANLMHRFFKNNKSCFNSIQRLTTTPSLFTYQKPFINNNNIESIIQKPDPVSFANPVITLSGNEFNQPMQFYPSFSMGLCLNPKMIQGLDLAETVSLVEEEDAKENVIYADSVKKKRKKKMNKHKYRKLRKQLGRKS
ncbi:unnamed protein product [Arabidopsis lyrata]|nr:unnamed protein product [Arabidopsis lyrata]